MYRYVIVIRWTNPDGKIQWYRICTSLADADIAELFAREEFKREHKDNEIEELYIKEYEFGDEKKRPEEIFSLKYDEKYKSPSARSARALERIAKELGILAGRDFSVRSELTPIVQNSGITPFLIFSSVCSLLTIIVLIVLKLLFR